MARKKLVSMTWWAGRLVVCRRKAGKKVVCRRKASKKVGCRLKAGKKLGCMRKASRRLLSPQTRLGEWVAEEKEGMSGASNRNIA